MLGKAFYKQEALFVNEPFGKSVLKKGSSLEEIIGFQICTPGK